MAETHMDKSQLARIINVHSDSLCELAEDILVFAYDSPEVIAEMMQDMNSLKLPQDRTPDSEIDIGLLRNPSDRIVSITLRQIAIGIQSVYEHVNTMAYKNGRDIVNDPIRIASNFKILARTENSYSDDEIYYTPDDDEIIFDLYSIKLFSTFIANPTVLGVVDNLIPELLLTEKEKRTIYEMPFASKASLAGAEEAYHGYQYNEIYRLIRLMSQASGLYNENIHGESTLRETDVVEVIRTAQNLINSSVEAKKLYDEYYDKAIKFVIESDLELHAISHEHVDYPVKNPFEIAAGWFCYQRAAEHGLEKVSVKSYPIIKQSVA